MAETTIDKELKAIKTVTDTLDPLDVETRRRVLNYAMQHLGLSLPEAPSHGQGVLPARNAQPTPLGPPGLSAASQEALVDIRSLKDQKKPTTDVEMATLVAYYLKYEAPKVERKDEIGTEEVEKYFVQAGYPLPANKAYTLPNAKKAGYLENASYGKYKLNSVGHNLVAHGMPRPESAGHSKPKRKKKTTKKATKKIATTKTKKKAKR